MGLSWGVGDGNGLTGKQMAGQYKEITCSFQVERKRETCQIDRTTWRQ
jgi:hypothetical protein